MSPRRNDLGGEKDLEDLKDLGGEKPALFFSSSALVNAIVSSRAEVCWPFNAEENFVYPTKAITKRRGGGKLCCREAIASRGPPMLKQDTELYKGLFG